MSNGPGDPQNNPTIIETVRELWYGALDIRIVTWLNNKINTVTAVKPAGSPPRMAAYSLRRKPRLHRHPESIDPKKAKLLYSNVNDGGCEGIEYKENGSFSVQFSS